MDKNFYSKFQIANKLTLKCDRTKLYSIVFSNRFYTYKTSWAHHKSAKTGAKFLCWLVLVELLVVSKECQGEWGCFNVFLVQAG